MSVYCKNCINTMESNLPSGELFCKVFHLPCDEILGCSREPKMQTNADYIRVMNDDGQLGLAAVDNPYDWQREPTNANKVRAMTDEELADWYWWMLKYVQGYTDSRVALLEWLKEKRDC